MMMIDVKDGRCFHNVSSHILLVWQILLCFY